MLHISSLVTLNLPIASKIDMHARIRVNPTSRVLNGRSRLGVSREDDAGGVHLRPEGPLNDLECNFKDADLLRWRTD